KSGEQSQRPPNALEAKLIELWERVLGLQGIGADDSFFELGGNSIQAAIFINRLQAMMGEVIHVVVIFEKPRVSELAAYLRHKYPEAIAGLLGETVDAEKLQ